MNGRRKGAKGELQVAALLQKWWRALEPSAIFRRTPSSGGWARGDEAKLAFQTAGDLTTTAASFPFCVEVKRREGWSLDNFLAGRDSPVWEWWLQAQTQGAEQDGEPMLWLRQNRMSEWMVLVRESYVHGLAADVRLALSVKCRPHTFERWKLTRGWAPVMLHSTGLLQQPPNFFASC